MRTLAKYLDCKTLIVVYHANFESLIRYGVVFYGGGVEFNKLFKIQKRIVRIMLHMKFLDSCRGKFRSINVLMAYGLYIQECVVFLFKHKHLFTEHVSQGTYTTRLTYYIFPKHHLTMTEKGPLYSCIKMFNKLPESIKRENELSGFKKRVFKLLLDIEPYNLGEYLSHNVGDITGIRSKL